MFNFNLMFLKVCDLLLHVVVINMIFVVLFKYIFFLFS